MKRQDKCGQDNPRDQVRVIISAAQGDLLVLEDRLANHGLSGMEVHLKRAYAFLNEAQELLKDMPTGEWDNPKFKD